jgi:glucosamine--fructose-6-phosphate aminotransferase (isomerizing)
VETSGVYAFGQDMEEWNHVEGFAYPLESMLVIHLNPGVAYKRAETLAISAGKIGHKIIVIVPEELKNIELGDARVVIYGPNDDLLSPLIQYIPFTLLAAVVAEEYGRAMFLTDTAIWSRL